MPPTDITAYQTIAPLDTAAAPPVPRVETESDDFDNYLGKANRASHSAEPTRTNGSEQEASRDRETSRDEVTARDTSDNDSRQTTDSEPIATQDSSEQPSEAAEEAAAEPGTEGASTEQPADESTEPTVKDASTPVVSSEVVDELAVESHSGEAAASSEEAAEELPPSRRVLQVDKIDPDSKPTVKPDAAETAETTSDAPAESKEKAPEVVATEKSTTETASVVAKDSQTAPTEVTQTAGETPSEEAAPSETTIAAEKEPPAVQAQPEEPQAAVAAVANPASAGASGAPAVQAAATDEPPHAKTSDNKRKATVRPNNDPASNAPTRTEAAATKAAAATANTIAPVNAPAEEALAPNASSDKPTDQETNSGKVTAPVARETASVQGGPKTPASLVPVPRDAGHDPTKLTPRDQARFVHRVANAFQAAAERGEIRLRLSPPELGQLKLEISIKQGVLTARMETDTKEARQVVLDNLPQLRERLAEQSIKVERFDVDVRDDSQQQATEQQSDNESGNNGSTRQASNSDAADSSRGELGRLVEPQIDPDQLDILI